MMLIMKYGDYKTGRSFFVLDEEGRKKYQVKHSVLLWNRKSEILDMDKNLLVTIKNEPKSLVKKKYDIFIGGEQKASITKELSLIPTFTIEGLDWQMRGVMRHSYEMLRDGQRVLSFQEESEHRYELEITDPADELLALAVVMTISYEMAAD